MTLQHAAILFPDAELWATGRIRSLLAARPESYAAGVKVDNKVPNPRPTRLVQIRRDGGVAEGVFDNPRLAINVFAPSEQDATDLARLVLSLTGLLPGDGVCVRVSNPTGPSGVTDAVARRLMSIEARLRGTELS